MLPIGYTARKAVEREALSALPDAPVVPEVESRRTTARMRTVRTSLAGVLHRAAVVVEPAECRPAR